MASLASLGKRSATKMVCLMVVDLRISLMVGISHRCADDCEYLENVVRALGIGQDDGGQHWCTPKSMHLTLRMSDSSRFCRR